MFLYDSLEIRHNTENNTIRVFVFAESDRSKFLYSPQLNVALEARVQPTADDPYYTPHIANFVLEEA